jgi:diphthamide biosynthesis methyltransferase
LSLVEIGLYEEKHVYKVVLKVLQRSHFIIVNVCTSFLQRRTVGIKNLVEWLMK